MAMALFSANIVNTYIFTCNTYCRGHVRLQASFLNFDNPTGNHCSFLISKKRGLMPWLMINPSVKFTAYNALVRKHSSLCLPREKATESQTRNMPTSPSFHNRWERDKLFVLALYNSISCKFLSPVIQSETVCCVSWIFKCCHWKIWSF